MKSYWFVVSVSVIFTSTTCKPAGDEIQPAPAVSSSVGGGNGAALDSFDDRTNVPLLPMMAHHQRVNMRDHLTAVQEIITAAATNDFASIQKAASRIGYSEQMGAMCTHMGAGAPGFTDLALDFHRTADTIGAAARQKDSTEVLAALGRTLAKCTGCHARFKQQVVDEATFRSLTRQAPPTTHPH
jgi:hypothetical protein